MVKKKQKKVVKQKQKQKQNVNVKQNVKVVVGDVKRKQVRKATGTKAGASAKPPIVLNISNPQPVNNAFMEYFKKQLQNQEPIKATALKQNEILNEREETKASKAGALHKLDMEPNDVAREMQRQRIKALERLQKAESERKMQEREVAKSIKIIKTPKSRRPVKLVLEDSSESSMLNELEQQKNVMEQAITNKSEESGLEAEAEESDIPPTPVMTYKPPANPITEKPKTVRRRGRKPLSEEVVQARLQEEKNLRRERLEMIAEDKPAKRRGRKMLTQEEIDRRKQQRELQKMFVDDTEGDY